MVHIGLAQLHGTSHGSTPGQAKQVSLRSLNAWHQINFLDMKDAAMMHSIVCDCWCLNIVKEQTPLKFSVASILLSWHTLPRTSL